MRPMAGRSISRCTSVVLVVEYLEYFLVVEYLEYLSPSVSALLCLVSASWYKSTCLCLFCGSVTCFCFLVQTYLSPSVPVSVSVSVSVSVRCRCVCLVCVWPVSQYGSSISHGLVLEYLSGTRISHEWPGLSTIFFAPLQTRTNAHLSRMLTYADVC